MMAGIAKVWPMLPRNSNWQKCVNPSGLKPLVFSTTVRSLSVVPDGVDRLTKFVDRSKKLFVLTGAGVSTESGIPDYVSDKTGFRDNKEFRDLLLMKKFKDKECTKYRQDHWLHNYLIWEKYSRMGPNDAHKVLKHLEDMGKINWLVTTNVDGFHKMAGNKNLTELHGSARRVVCLGHGYPPDCREEITREEMQKRIKQMNEWLPNLNSNQRLNELVEREEYQKELKVPACPACNGILRPGFVFKDEDIGILEKGVAEIKLEDSDAMLVVGTSLQHGKSGNSLVKQAEEQGKPIAIINIGRTNAERFKIDARCQDVLVRLKQNISSGLSQLDNTHTHTLKHTQTHT